VTEFIHKLINRLKQDLILKNSKQHRFFKKNNKIKIFWINLSQSRIPACNSGHDPNQV
jgi:hypothetical protein